MNTSECDQPANSPVYIVLKKNDPIDHSIHIGPSIDCKGSVAETGAPDNESRREAHVELMSSLQVEREKQQSPSNYFKRAPSPRAAGRFPTN